MPDERTPDDAANPTKTLPTPPTRSESAAPESLRTLPLEEGVRLREELQAALRDARKPTVVVMSGSAVGQRHRLLASVVLGAMARVSIEVSPSDVEAMRVLVTAAKWVKDGNGPAPLRCALAARCRAAASPCTRMHAAARAHV